jgi:hypothetical protein
LKRLNPGGVIILHDTDPITDYYINASLCCDAYKIVKKLEDRTDINITTIPLEEAGLSIVTKKQDTRYNLRHSPRPSPRPTTDVIVILRYAKDERGDFSSHFNKCYDSVRKFHPDKKVVVIDDTPLKYVDRTFGNGQNYEVIRTSITDPKLQGKAEMLPFYYFHKHRWADRMLFLHDSVHLSQRLPDFNDLDYKPVMDHMSTHAPQCERSVELLNLCKEGKGSEFNLSGDWHGSTGTMCLISLALLDQMQNDFNILELVNVMGGKEQPGYVGIRYDRCTLEKIIPYCVHKTTGFKKSHQGIAGSLYVPNNVIVKMAVGR